ncbi:g5257 [Coccomyxa viridis]|uniref:G5257 protein n=1 Tax=Coccomyxa viridis TaxID=1274662 RepID=A0ABP1FSC3_9CHLO
MTAFASSRQRKKISQQVGRCCSTTSCAHSHAGQVEDARTAETAIRHPSGGPSKQQGSLNLARLRLCLILMAAVQCAGTCECAQTVLTDDSLYIWRRTFTGEHEGVEQQLHLWMRCQHHDSHVRLRALLVREPARDSIDPTHGILKGPEEWEPQVTVAVNATASHNLTYVFPGGSKGRPHAPLLLTANMSDVAPAKGGWQVTVEGLKGLHVFDARWCVRHHHARSLNNIIALRPFLNQNLETGATLLVHHIVYHGCLGVKLHHVYVEPGQAEILLQNCQLAHLHRAQRVVFFEWPMRQFDGVVGPDRYGGHEISVRLQYWQMVQNNHALLTYWGTGAKVALLDIDEFLFGPAFGAATQGACMQHVYMACKGCQAGISEYAQVWSNHSTSWALQQYEDITEDYSLNQPTLDAPGSTFDWEKQWYPLAFIEDLDPKVPTPVQLLGQRLVLWRDSQQQWRCFADICPHRLAPLSEGRIEPSDGTLMCSYHGWRFQGDGKCTNIPQALDEKSSVAACSSPRSCASTRPTQVLQGKVWVWGQGGGSAEEDSKLVEPALIAELEDQWPPRGQDGQPWDVVGAEYMRDLPYGWATLVENIMDPAHELNEVLNASTNLPQWVGIGKGTPADRAPSPADSFSMPVTNFDNQARRFVDFNIRFVPPCQATWTNPPIEEKALPGLLVINAVPTAPGQCRVLLTAMYPRSSLPGLFRSILALMPRSMKHLAFSARIFDGDSSLLHAQEVIALDESAAKGPDYRKLYYMPTQSDRLVAAFRTWLSGRGGGGPVPLTGKKDLLPEHELLNNYDQHVRHCPSCSKALVTLERARHMVAGAGALCMLGISAVLGRAAPLNSAGILGLTAGAAMALALWLLMGPYIQRFRFVPYDHSA